MGDRTTVWVTCIEKDVQAVREAFGWSMDDDLPTEEYENLVTTEFEEVNYGGTDQLQALAEKGIAFTACSGSGDSYGESLVAAHKGKTIEVASLEQKPACVILDNGRPDPKVMAVIRRYLKLRAKAMKAFKAAR